MGYMRAATDQWSVHLHLRSLPKEKARWVQVTGGPSTFCRGVPAR